MIADPPKLIVTDLDGTLLDATGARVSPRNVAVLQRAQAAGTRVVVATGRPVWWLGPVTDAGFDGTAVCMNGAVVYDMGEGRLLSEQLMSPQVMSELVDALSGLDAAFAIAVERSGSSVGQAWAENDYQHPWSLGEFQLAERHQLIAEPAAKMLLSGPARSGQLADLVQRTGVTGVSITYSSDEGLVEIAAAGVNKGSVLRRLADDWGIAAGDAIAFGDMPNDLEMLQWAGTGVAMANAHPDVLAVASARTAHHDDDGVAEYLERWF